MLQTEGGAGALPREDLNRLVQLRYNVAAVIAAALAFARFGMDMDVALAPSAAAIGFLLALNVATHFAVRRGAPFGERGLFANLGAEVLALTVLFYFTGGSTNPLVSLYLLPLVVAGAVLPRAYTWSMAGVTAVCYTLLLVWYVPLAPEHMHHQHAEAASAFNAHVFGMWATFVLSAVLIAHFVARMASSLRERDRMLAAAREEALRNERIVALGTLAAGAAHELGTPLATMQLIADHLEAHADQCPQFAEDVADLQAQVATCKRIISEMAARAGSARDESALALPADRFLDDVVDKWRLMRPQAKSAHRWASSRPAPAIYVEPTLYQAVINLFNNAADASPEEVDIVGRADEGAVVIEILDRGPGLTPEVQARAGQPFFSTKAPGKGMGIGLFLANATIERNGGRVSIFNREGGGACTRVALPALAGNTGAT